MEPKDTKVKSLKIPLLPIYLIFGKEVRRIEKSLVSAYVSNRVIVDQMAELSLFRTRYGSVRHLIKKR
jgi:hypothetical protein